MLTSWHYFVHTNSLHFLPLLPNLSLTHVFKQPHPHVVAITHLDPTGTTKPPKTLTRPTNMTTGFGIGVPSVGMLENGFVPIQLPPILIPFRRNDKGNSPIEVADLAPLLNPLLTQPQQLTTLKLRKLWRNNLLPTFKLILRLFLPINLSRWPHPLCHPLKIPAWVPWNGNYHFLFTLPLFLSRAMLCFSHHIQSHLE